MSIPHDSASLYCHSTLRRGGEGGIRTHETVARLRHFQCRALGQLCDLSRKLSAISLSCSVHMLVGGGTFNSAGYHCQRLREADRRRPILVCGGGGIRTHERLAPLAVFETAALGHYATPPDTGKYSIVASSQ